MTNDDMSKIVDTSDEWIYSRSGIKQRHYTHVSTGKMAWLACERALAAAGVYAEEIDLIIVATSSPDRISPSTACIMAKRLDVKKPAFDINAVCTGFVYGVQLATNLISTKQYKNILVIGAENHSGGLERSNRGRNVTVIFGDGAGAAVLSRSEEDGKGILSSHLHSEGKYAKELALEGPSTSRWVPEIIAENNPDDESYYPYMNGQFVFKNAVVRFSEAIIEGLEANGLQKEDIKMLIPQQAKLRIAQFNQRKFQLNDDQVYNNIMNYGNTTAASVIIALTEI